MGLLSKNLNLNLNPRVVKSRDTSRVTYNSVHVPKKTRPAGEFFAIHLTLHAMEESSQANAIAAWCDSLKEEAWRLEEKKKKIRSARTRRISVDSLQLNSEGAAHSTSFEKPTLTAKHGSFRLSRPSLPDEFVCDPGCTSESPSPSSSWWIFRRLKKMLRREQKHTAAWLDYNSSSDLDGRTLCIDSMNVDMF
jgi:hypothetical protein